VPPYIEKQTNLVARVYIEVSMDIIFINRLPVRATVGCYPWEQRMPQPLWLDLEIAINCQQSAQTDQLDNTVNYVALKQAVEKWCTENSFQLIETFAHQLAEMLRMTFQLPWIKLSVTKPGVVIGTQQVGVTIERGQRE
jgi:dihydroneopterin aldolase